MRSQIQQLYLRWFPFLRLKFRFVRSRLKTKDPEWCYLTPNIRTAIQGAFFLFPLCRPSTVPFASSKTQALALSFSFIKHTACTFDQAQIEYLEAQPAHHFENCFYR